MIQMLKVDGPSSLAAGWSLRLGTFEKVNAVVLSPMNCSGVTLAASANLLGWSTVVKVEDFGRSGSLIMAQIYQSGVQVTSAFDFSMYKFAAIVDGY